MMTMMMNCITFSNVFLDKQYINTVWVLITFNKNNSKDYLISHVFSVCLATGLGVSGMCIFQHIIGNF